MQKIKKEIFRFIVVGSGAVLTDTLVYFLLINFLPFSISKTISFLSGTLVAYIFNKYWTFEVKKKSYSEMMRFLALYLSTLVANVAMNKGVLLITNELAILAFLVATGTSTILNFLGQKFWVFRDKS